MSKPSVQGGVKYVPGQNKTADELHKAYEGLTRTVFGEGPQPGVETRDPSDPFGLKQTAQTTDSFPNALEPTQRLVKFFSLLCHDFKLGPKAGVFMMELASLNVLNAEDIPLTAAEIEAARKAAFEYYAQVRAALPATKPEP